MENYRLQNGCHNCINLYTVSSYHKGIERYICKKDVKVDGYLGASLSKWSPGRDVQSYGICDDWDNGLKDAIQAKKEG